MRWTALLVFGVGLLIYGSTLGPYVSGGDSGELAAAACRGGVAHPPGYPLFILLERAFLLLPWSTPIGRLNFMTALCAAGTMAAMVLFARRLQLPPAAAVAAVALYATADPVWHFAVSSEVFALNSLLVMLALIAALAVQPGAAGAAAATACGLCLGLGLAHHQTSVVVAAPLAFYVLIGCGAGWPRRLAGLLVGGGIGLLPYLYLPWAAKSDWLYAWGDTSTWDGFLTHVLRREYGTWQLMQVPGAATYASKLQAYGDAAWRGSWGAGPVLAAIGTLAAWRQRRAQAERWWLLLALIWGGYVLAFHALANVDLRWATHRLVLTRFWILPQLLLALLAGRGLAAVLAGTARAMPWLPPWLATAAVAAAVAALGASHYQRNDLSHNDRSERFARATLASMPPRALALLRGDLALPLVYLQACEGVRPDVLLLNRLALQVPWARQRLARLAPQVLLPPGRYQPSGPLAADAFDLAALLSRNSDRMPMVLQTFRADLTEYQQTAAWQERFRILPWGALMLVQRAEEEIDGRWYLAASRVVLTALSAQSGTAGDAWDQLAADEASDAAYLRGAYLAVAAAQQLALAPLARQALSEAAAWPGQPPARIWKAMGYTYAAEAATDPSRWPLAAAAWEEFLRLADPADAERPLVAALLARLQGGQP